MESTQKERKKSYKFYNLKCEEITEGLQEMMILVLVKILKISYHIVFNCEWIILYSTIYTALKGKVTQ